jgi:NTE family protein
MNPQRPSARPFEDGLSLKLARALRRRIPTSNERRAHAPGAPPEIPRRQLTAAGALAAVSQTRGADGRQPSGHPLRRGRADPKIVMVVASLGVFMAFVDDTVVGIAFPNMVRSFHDADLAELSWVLNAYNIALAALMVPAGVLADVVGRRRMYMIGICVFTLGSAFCAAAPSIGALIAARAFQGVGAAIVVPASLAIVLHAAPAARRAQAVAVWSATAAIAAGIGPVIGGVLIDVYDWRLVFLINLPIGALTWFLARREVVESRAPGRRLVPDSRGAALLALAVGALTLAIVEGPDWGWMSTAVIAAFAVSAGAAFALARRCLRHAAPIVDLELLRAPGFTVTAALTVIGAAGFFALGLANLLFMMQVWRYSPLETGLAITPAPFVAALSAGLAGRLARRFDARRLVMFGALVWTIGPLILLARMGPQPDYLGAYLPAAVVLAIGVGFAFPLITDAAVAVAPRGRFAGASACNGSIRQIGAAIGIAVLAAILGSSVRSGSVGPYHAGWWFATACFAAVAVGSLALAPPRVPELDDEQELDRRREELRRIRPTGVAVAARTAQPSQLADPLYNDEALLSDVAMFAALSPLERRALVDQAETIRVEGGEWLFRQGDPADAMYVVRSGRLDVLREEQGEPELLNELGRGSIIGELGLLSAENRSASIRSRRDATLLRVDRDTFTKMLADARFATGIARALGEQLRHSRPIDARTRTNAATIAVVRHPGEPRAAQVEQELLSALGETSDVVRLDEGLVRRHAPEGDLGVALAQVLDRAETHHELVVLCAGAEPDEGWLGCCLRQADRLVLILDAHTALWRPGPNTERLSGCTAVLLDPAGDPAVSELLDSLAPRTTHRVRGGDDVRRLARRLAGRAVGLVLSGGGARGFAHLGVIAELEAAGITIDRIGGASMGAFIGALFAQGIDVDEIEARCYWEFVRNNPIGDYRLPLRSLIRGSRARAMLHRNLEGLIEDLPRSFFCVTTDIISAQLVVHRRGELATAVGASMSIPGIFPPVVIGQRLLVDGGVLDNMPVSTMAADREGPIIAADVTEPEQRSLAPDEAPPQIGLIDTLARVMNLGTTDTEALGRRHADLLITPDKEDVGRLEFHMIDTMRDAGRTAAIRALENAPARVFG